MLIQKKTCRLQTQLEIARTKRELPGCCFSSSEKRGMMKTKQLTESIKDFPVSPYITHQSRLFLLLYNKKAISLYKLHTIQNRSG